MSNSEKVITILSLTSDGDKLAPRDLQLCEAAVNGRLSEHGERAFSALYDEVKSGEYERSGGHWLYGIPNLTKSGDGYVFWKGKVIEHYSYRDSEAEQTAAQKLAEYCQQLEAKGIPVCGRTATNSTLFRDAPAGTPWLSTMLNYYTFFSDQSGKPVWAVFSAGNHAAAAVRMVDGKPEVIHEFESDYSFGTYHMFHRLQNAGYESCSDKIRIYQDVVDMMTAIGITPEQVDQVLSNVPQPEESAPAPSMA